ncbi:baseplate J/gp47 family protein [Paenibacillus sp. YYML68]|uniref:baseplate J/gp47 family protein n=1 Tax=Paenibacillus sp. YYML68 TaxID=2909250 RepID=UPI002491D26D|nr:baseplate J/gp47 family protein [Paenibacillus sp. YYML68]
MYEHQTYEAILQRMLGRVPDDVDKREGSIIYDALAPAAAELAQVYIELDTVLKLSFADTSSGEYLDRRVSESGVYRESATFAKRKGLFYDSQNNLLDIPLGSRFAIGQLHYIAEERLAAVGEYVMVCESAGTVGNQQFGVLTPVEYIDDLVRAELTDVLVPGEDEESDESLRQRYVDALQEQPFGGNAADYRQKIGAISGVGGVKVLRAWAGGGTVKCIIIGADYNSPTQSLIDTVQQKVDPLTNPGEGLGLAPMGHIVTVEGTADHVVNVTTTLTLATGVTIGQVEADVRAVIEAYLLALRQSWEDAEYLVVRTSQIEARILTVLGIADISGTMLNGSSANVTLDSHRIPKLGTVTLYAS